MTSLVYGPDALEQVEIEQKITIKGAGSGGGNSGAVRQKLIRKRVIDQKNHIAEQGNFLIGHSIT